MPCEQTNVSAIEEIVRPIVEDESWQDNPQDIRVPLNADEPRIELVYDVLYDNFCMPLGTRCRCVIFPTVEETKFTCCKRPKQIVGTYHHKKEIVSGDALFDKNFTSFGFPTGNVRYFVQEQQIRDILQELVAYEPVFKIGVHKTLTKTCKQKVHVLKFYSNQKITNPDHVVLIFKLIALGINRFQQMGACSTVVPEFSKLKSEPNLHMRTCPMGKLPWVQNTSIPV